MELIKDNRSLILGVTLSVVVILIIAALTKYTILKESVQVAMIFVGVLTMAALHAFNKYLDSSPKAPLIHISLNQLKVRNVLKEYAAGIREQKEMTQNELKETPWEMAPGDLLVIDNSLALAKLRIDLEKEIRRLAFKNYIQTEKTHGLKNIMDNLLKDELLPAPVVSATHEIISVANKALHGAQISMETVESVLELGRDIIDFLKFMNCKVE